MSYDNLHVHMSFRCFFFQFSARFVRVQLGFGESDVDSLVWCFYYSILEVFFLLSLFLVWFCVVFLGGQIIHDDFFQFFGLICCCGVRVRTKVRGFTFVLFLFLNPWWLFLFFCVFSHFVLRMDRSSHCSFFPFLQLGLEQCEYGLWIVVDLFFFALA